MINENPINSVSEVLFNPLKPINSTLDVIDRLFDAGEEVVRLKGLPQKTFLFFKSRHIAEIYKHAENGIAKNPTLLPRVKHVMRTGSYIMDGGREWRKRRKQIESAFQNKCLIHFANTVPKLTAQLVNKWEKDHAQGEVFDVLPDLQRLIVQLTLKMYLSTDINDQDLEKVTDYTGYVNDRFVRLTPLWLPTPQNFKFKKKATQLRLYFIELVKKRRSQETKGDDLLSVLVGIKDSHGQPWSDDAVVDEIYSIFFGTWVVSSTMGWGLYLLGSNPKVQEKLSHEISSVLKGNSVQAMQLKGFSYAPLVVKELLRLYPASWGYPRFCDKEMTVGPYQIPSKSNVIPMVHYAHRFHGLWRDPFAFNPDRFEKKSGGVIPEYAYFPFGGGARTCMGLHLAPMILQLFMITVLQRYQIVFHPRFEGDPEPVFAFEMHPKDQINISIQQR